MVDILLLKQRQLYLLGKRAGRTNLTIWRGERQPVTLALVVTPDLNGLKQQLHQLLPNEPIAVHASHDRLVLAGEVSSLRHMEMALALAASFVGQEGGAAEVGTPAEATTRATHPQLINLLQVGEGRSRCCLR